VTSDGSPIFHLALADDWQRAVDSAGPYYPPTYDTDGFTHGTSDLPLLLTVANHFYADSTGDWVCLQMTEKSLAARSIAVKYERAAPVGSTSGDFAGSDDIWFPHILGGIPAGSVTAVYAVTRDHDGRFLRIEV